MTKSAKHPVKAIYTMEEIIESLETLDGERFAKLAETLVCPQTFVPTAPFHTDCEIFAIVLGLPCTC